MANAAGCTGSRHWSATFDGPADVIAEAVSGGGARG
jgi:hypothetical protein